MNKNKDNQSSHCICGFWFHITWNGNEGIDQRGNKWNNPDNPTPEDPNLVDNILDIFNDVKRKLDNL